MASLPAPQEIHSSVQFVEPIELDYVNQGIFDGANWDLPTKERPEAFLIDAKTIDVTGEADRKANAFRTLKVGFELEVATRSSGFKNSNVHIGVKLTKDGVYEYQSVQKQIADMKPMQKTWVTAEFPVNGNPVLGGKIHFQLMDTTAKVLKGGLKLSKVKVEQVGFTN